MVLHEQVSIADLIQHGQQNYPERIKFCIDKKRKVVAIDSPMHIDMEYELIDDGSEPEDIFGGDIMIDKAPEYSIVWEAHPNILQNMRHGYGTGRKLTDRNIQADLFNILTAWVK